MKSADRLYMRAVAELGCMVCAAPAEVHHIRAGQGMAQRAGNHLIIPLCPEHHRIGGHGVAIHAGRKAWEALYGTELEMLDKVIGKVFNNSMRW